MSVEALSAVRVALLADAERDAAAIVDRARLDGEQIVARAEQEVAQAVAQARHRAEITSRAQAAAAISSARQAAHEALLHVETELRQALIDEVYARVDRFPADPRYPALVEHLRRLVQRQLGDGATVECDPEGGVIGTDCVRRVDYRLRSLADRALDEMAEEVTDSWS